MGFLSSTQVFAVLPNVIDYPTVFRSLKILGKIRWLQIELSEFL